MTYTYNPFTGALDLAGAAAGAQHPANHPASIITQDADNRFVTDAEKAAWGGKQAALVSGTNIKTLGGQSLLGVGDVPLPGGFSVGDLLTTARALTTSGTTTSRVSNRTAGTWPAGFMARNSGVRVAAFRTSVSIHS